MFIHVEKQLNRHLIPREESKLFTVSKCLKLSLITTLPLKKPINKKSLLTLRLS